MQVVALTTPNAWALRAVDALVARGAGLGGILVDILVLAAFGALFLWLATFELRRSRLLPRGTA
jgi:ABC-type multidrug transport system permease subunit